MHNTTTHTRKANAADYGLPGRWATVTVLPAGNRGRNARGLSASRVGWGGNPRHAKHAKRQGNERMGNSPSLRMSTMGSWV